MSDPVKIFVPLDSAAQSVGAGRVAISIVAEATRLGRPVSVVRTGSRGLFWLEPMVEIETPQGRVAYGPVDVENVPELFAAGWLQGGEHHLRLGDPALLPFLANQERLVFARCGLAAPLDLAAY